MLGIVIKFRAQLACDFPSVNTYLTDALIIFGMTGSIITTKPPIFTTADWLFAEAQVQKDKNRRICQVGMDENNMMQTNVVKNNVFDLYLACM